MSARYAKNIEDNKTNSLYIRYGKRVFDFTAALAGTIFLLPLFSVISLLIKLDSPGSVFFLQERVGRNFRNFRLIKFRTMKENAPSMGPALTKRGDSRITRVGRYLRRYKLDELPQLLNVIKGDLSLVGPRPELQKYVAAFKDDYQEILRIRPGITDFAAVEFRDEEETLQKFDDIERGYLEAVLPRKIELYKKYLNEASFSTDLKLVLKTLLAIPFSKK